MVTASLGTVLLLVESILGGHPHPFRAAGGCGCGVHPAAVLAQIHRLQASPNWRARDDAAGELRDFDWRCHPEVVEALAAALLRHEVLDADDVFTIAALHGVPVDGAANGERVAA